MSRYYLRFRKDGYSIYTSHLDMQRLFKRAFAKAGVALEFSQGFNPHPRMSFALPLSLGYKSEGELLEFKLRDDLDVDGKSAAPGRGLKAGGLTTDKIVEKLNRVLPQGISVLECREMAEVGKGLAAHCKAAEYKIVLTGPFYGIGETIDKEEDNQKKGRTVTMPDGEALDAFLAQKEILIQKKKKGRKYEFKEVDIRPLILDLKVDRNGDDDNFIMFTRLAAGSGENLSPQALLQAFQSFYGLSIPPENVEITRLSLEIEGL